MHQTANNDTTAQRASIGLASTTTVGNLTTVRAQSTHIDGWPYVNHKNMANARKCAS